MASLVVLSDLGRVTVAPVPPPAAQTAARARSRPHWNRPREILPKVTAQAVPKYAHLMPPADTLLTQHAAKWPSRPPQESGSARVTEEQMVDWKAAFTREFQHRTHRRGCGRRRPRRAAAVTPG